MSCVLQKILFLSFISQEFSHNFMPYPIVACKYYTHLSNLD